MVSSADILEYVYKYEGKPESEMPEMYRGNIAEIEKKYGKLIQTIKKHRDSDPANFGTYEKALATREAEAKKALGK